MVRRDRDRLELVVIAVFLGALVALPLVYVAEGPRGPRQPPPPPVGIPVNTTLSVGGYLGTHYANPFYAVLFADDDLATARLQALGAFLNSTPITWFRFGGNGTSYDPTTGVDYVPPAGGGRYVATPHALWNLTWFKSWCDAREPHCRWMAFLPGEENDSQYALHTAEWYHQDLGLVPDYWQFGNEPTGWTHYGENLSAWSTTDDLPVSDNAYTTMVRDYIDAISAVYPSDRYIALEAACGCNYDLAEATSAALGPAANVMAFHAFPSASGSTTQPSAFLGALEGSSNLTQSAARFRSALSAGCPTCSNVAVQVGAYQAGPPGGLSALQGAYVGAPFLAASIIQAIQANVSSFTVYDSDSLYNTTAMTVRPQGLLYQDILSNMTMGEDFAVNFQDEGIGGVYGLLVHNGSRQSLLIVNTNSTYELNLTVSNATFPVGALGSEWSWGPQTATPVAQPGLSLPTRYAVPAQGLLLLDNY